MSVFLYGSLRDPALLAVVVGRLPEVLPATLPDHAVRAAGDEAFPQILPEAGATARGLVALGLTGDEIARLAFYEAGFHLAPAPVPAETASGPCEVQLFLPGTAPKAGAAPETETGTETVSDAGPDAGPGAGGWPAGAPWSYDAWRARWGETTVATARAFMAEYGRDGGRERAHRRWPLLLARGASQVRARAPAPVTLRRAVTAGDISVAARREPYANYFAIEEYDLSWRRFDGAMGRETTRAVFVSSDAVLVLPYDPVRDRVQLIEQFRMGPFARGDAEPWLLEVAAGRIDGGETPEEAARREAIEESGTRMRELIAGPRGYASPGAITEYLYFFIGICDLPDRDKRIGGLEDEDEDIRAHVLAFDELMALVDSGEIDSTPIHLLANWLARIRPRLRAAAGVPG
ncbi:NUDIX domain-containing protein [Frigidibacter sp. MR17.24]|uniref:NUDIX domain-containing protein n=1 Tax=Frigidibacter sp. MR17.24 TaxID=3127345 RepID=UPI003012A9BC